MAIVLAQLRLTQETIVSELNIAYQQTAGPTNENTAVGACKAIGDAFFASIVPLLSDKVTFESVKCRVVDDGPFPTRIANRNNEKGGNVSNALPAHMCAVINFRNAAGDLKRPGRVMLSGLPTIFLSDGNWTVAATETIKTAWETNMLQVEELAAPSFSGFQVVARRAVGPGPPIPYTGIPIDSVDIPIEVGSRLQRKGRKLGIPG